MNATTRKPKVVQIGVGRWGLNHLRVWKKLHSLGLCELLGVVDTDPNQLREVERRFEIRGYKDAGIVEQCDAADVVVPTYDHFKVTQYCLEARKDVMVEKPMVETVQQASALEALAQKQGDRILMVGHLFRYNPATERLRQAVASGELGRVSYLRGRFMGFRYTEHDAGVLATVSIHFIYVANFILGQSPDSVTAVTAHNLGLKLDDYGLLVLHYGKQYAVIESDYFTPGKYRTMQVVGSEKIAVGDLLAQQVDIHNKRHVHSGERYEALDEGVAPAQIQFQEPLELELRHFLDCVNTRQAPMTGLKEGAEAVRIVEAAYESARLGKTVSLR